MHETVANKCERDHDAGQYDDPQQCAAWLTGPDADANCSPHAADAELPALSPSLDLIKLDEHRLCPVHLIRRQTLRCEDEQ